ncbi:MAG: methyltransferase domain-containing protein [Treponema sp.]|nr:methyltransferase domain-containing protein [Treponema sp.]
MTGRILLVPSIEPGRGTGHLRRLVKLTKDLRALGRDAWLYPGENAAINIDPDLLITEIKTDAAKIDFFVLDRFQTPMEEFEKYRSIAPVIGIDEGGQCREYFDFLIDILVPNARGRLMPNIADPSLLQVPNKRPVINHRDANSSIEKVLVSFGGEDSVGLGPAAAQALLKNTSGKMDITLVTNRACKIEGFANNTNIRIIESIPSLAEHLCDYDLLITHYGLTAYEALYSGTPVLLISPTAYHEKLAKEAGFYSTSVKRLGRIFKNYKPRINTDFQGKEREKNGNVLCNSIVKKIKKHCQKLAKKHNLDKEPQQNPVSLVNSYNLTVNKHCPICDSRKYGIVLWRFAARTYRQCPRCGGVYMERANKPLIEYGREYFFDQYKNQYGKTYIEDFPALTLMAKRRLGIIRRLLPSGGTLLDIGCAYGPFLAAAREEGFLPAGIDPAADAVNYVRQTLGLPAFQGFFPQSPVPIPSSQLYDVITLWFVIEHFENCFPIFNEIRKLLKGGGILAFSTPSYTGVSGRSSMRRFLENSPGDHFTIWSPRMVRKALGLAGFNVKKIIVSGHHPERFPLFGKFAKNKKSPLYWLLLAVSKIFSLGDTFEVYAALLQQQEKA